MSKRRFRILSLSALLASAAAVMTGCYTHVTRASGPGAEGYKVHERNTDNIVLGKWFGEAPQSGSAPSE